MPDLSFSGINTYAHLPHVKCLSNASFGFDVAILGAPFDVSSPSPVTNPLLVRREQEPDEMSIIIRPLCHTDQELDSVLLESERAREDILEREGILSRIP